MWLNLLILPIAVLLALLASPATAGEAEVENGALRGVLVMPDGEARAAAVIIPGSGPTDRDGNNPLGVKASYLRMLAQALAAEGIASVRIDKRGLFASAGAGDPNAVTFGGYAADARSWAKIARGKAATACTWLIGHSEGGLVALVAAAEAGPSLCGLVLVAAPGRPMGEVLREQLDANPANTPLLPDAHAAIDALEHGRQIDVSRFHPALQTLFSPGLQDFLIDAFSRDPARLIAGLALPVLIVQGDNDLQVGVADAQRLAAARPAAELVILPGMNHVLKQAPAGDVPANLASYADPEMPLAPGLAEAVAGFILRER